MLRIISAAIGWLCVAGGLLELLRPEHSGMPVLIIGLLVVASLFFEGRYRSGRVNAAANWEATGEKFIDPGTGKVVEVDYDPQTGERNYRQT